MPQIGVPELVLVLLIVVFVFGAGKLPELGGAIGKGIREFRQSVSEAEPPARPSEAESLGEAKAV